MPLYNEIHRSAGDHRRLFVVREQRIRGRRRLRRSGAGRRSTAGRGAAGRHRGPVNLVFQQYLDDGMRQDGPHAGHWRRRADRGRLFALGRGVTGVQRRRHVHRLDGGGGRGRRGPLVRWRREHRQRRLGHRVMIVARRYLRPLVHVLHVGGGGRFSFRKVRQEEPAIVVEGLRRHRWWSHGRRRMATVGGRRRRRFPVVHFVQHRRQVVERRVVL